MIDAYGRRIEYMRISVTDRCNLRCVYCMPPEGVPLVRHEDILSFDEIVLITKSAAACGIRDVRLTGGEPLVRRGLPDLVRMIRAIPGIRRIGLTTNGILLPGCIKELYEAGVRFLNISLDTLDPELYRRMTRGGVLSETLEGVESARPYIKRADDPLCVKLDCVLTGVPGQQLTDVAELARGEKIHVRFIELMPIGQEAQKCFQGGGQGKAGSGPVRMQDVMNRLRTAFGEPERDPDFSCGSGPAEYWRFPGFKGRIGFIAPMSHAFCDQCSRLRLTAEGRLISCLAYNAGADLRKLLRGGCTDGELGDAIRAAILKKPENHTFLSGSVGNTGRRTMNRIGG